MKNTLINLDCMEWLPDMEEIDTLFADPPDNIGLGYQTYKDKLPDEQYVELLSTWLHLFVYKAKTVWFCLQRAAGRSRSARIVSPESPRPDPWAGSQACVQTFTFGQHCHHDLGNNHRPLLRLRWSDAPLWPDAIRVPSWRQENGDKRADPRGRVPGDVFDFTRVVGNSKQRRTWHPTQLNEGLVERCLKMTTPAGGNVVDPFGGTGTTLSVCRQLGLHLHPFRDRQGLLREDRRRARAGPHGLLPSGRLGGGMIQTCTRCEGSGFLNLEQVDDATLKRFDETGDPQLILDWIEGRDAKAAECGGCYCAAMRMPPCSYLPTTSMMSAPVTAAATGSRGAGLSPGLHDSDNPEDPRGCR